MVISSPEQCYMSVASISTGMHCMQWPIDTSSLPPVSQDALYPGSGFQLSSIYATIVPNVQAKWEATEAGKAVPRPLPLPPGSMPETAEELPKGVEAITDFNNEMSAYWSMVSPIRTLWRCRLNSRLTAQLPSQTARQDLTKLAALATKQAAFQAWS